MIWILTLLLLLVSGCSNSAAQAPYDVVITGGSVIDGNGTPAVRADVGIRDGRIATIGNLAAIARPAGASTPRASPWRPASSTCTTTRTTRSCWSRRPRA